MPSNSELAGTWDIDPAHTRIGFSARHAMVTKVRGAFNDVAGYAVIDPEHPTDSEIEIRVQLASVDTRNEQRDEHLRSADFFDVENHPEMIFTATSVDEIEENNYVVVGELTIREIARPVTVPLQLRGLERDPFGALRAGLEGTRRIDRREWGLEWNTPLDSGGVLVSEKITLEFELSLVKREE
ncbi:YceI family protein [Enteractinococcus helveticum]|uniref:Polyisoprenoid-binding protein n=1 Tax=Enteractinococcus helveticum TaxID=1837282 RepID=A0A1B7LYR1_9MICC|nr:YceI family protein [Enteractinococcus helveticum]OAV60501.1 polyisoprenoid-binding protein [Enteractinococcus helveticum]